jgi:glycosyltransferase involved in cell wall biosynthesis
MMMLRNKFRVAMLAPISWRVPPRHYGPWEQVVSTLTEGLVARGVDVTLFATADSLTLARLDAVCPRGYSEDPELDAKVWEGLHIAHCFERAGDFDLIHNHFDFLPLSYSRLVPTPVLTTIHGFSSRRLLPAYGEYNGHVHYVSISDADRAEELDYIATIHHGIALEKFPLAAKDEGYLLFFGRIHPDKGCAEAIALALRLRRRLVIAGIIQDERYFAEKVQPHLGGWISFIGAVGPERRAETLGGASALLHLINFDEPFGLSVVEAMACGTPVIANARGSMPEIVQHGVNGFLVHDLDEAAAAVNLCAQLGRRAVRASVETRFSAQRMVNDYIGVYERIAKRRVVSVSRNAAVPVLEF